MNKTVKLSEYIHPSYEVGKVVARHLTELHQLFTDDRQDLVNVKITYRGNDEWLCIAKRYGGDGGLQVCFGGGSDVYSALSSLSASVREGRWKADKYANGNA
jgi:hypothetical protein